MAPYIIHLFRGIEFHTGIWRELILPLEQQGWNLRFLSRTKVELLLLLREKLCTCKRICYNQKGTISLF